MEVREELRERSVPATTCYKFLEEGSDEQCQTLLRD